MTTALNETVLDVIDYLTALVRDGARPDEAQARLRRLRARHPVADLDLVWEEEAYDQSVHYDALLSLPSHETLSISVCADRALPWPLRGVHRWSDQDLVRVNDVTLKVQHAIACLDFIWNEAPIVDRLVRARLIREELAANPIELSDADLQEAMDSFRRAQRLYTAEDTHRWMARRGMTHEKLEEYVGDEAIVAKLRERVAAGDVEAYFEGHRSEFDRVCVAQVVMPDEDSARRTYERLLGGELNLYEAAQQQALGLLRRPEQRRIDTFAVLRRGETSEAMASIFDAAPGQLVVPFRTDDGFIIAQVLAVVPACLDEATRRLIERILFEEWFEERLRAARVEWNWGNAQRTSDIARPVSTLSSVRVSGR